MAEKRFDDYTGAIDRCKKDVRDGSCDGNCNACPLGPRDGYDAMQDALDRGATQRLF
jgi:hypothetical protein